VATGGEERVLEPALNVRGIIIIDVEASARIFAVVCTTRELAIYLESRVLSDHEGERERERERERRRGWRN